MLFIFIALVIFLFDQLSKYFIEKKYKLYESKEIIKDKVYITNIKNYGAAYGFLKNKPIILKIVSFVSLLFIFFYFLKALKSEDNVLKISFAFLLGGSIGNIIDRFRKKYVTDFIFFNFHKKAPVFNIADMFVFIGALIFFIKSFKES